MKSSIAADLRGLAVPTADLVLDPKNARKHDVANLRAIAASLRQFGQLKPLVVHRASRQVVAGNGTLLAARQLGWTHVAVVWVDHDPAAQRGYAVADNRTAELAEWDDAMLAELLPAIQQSTPALYEELLLEQFAVAQPEEKAGGKGKNGDAPKKTCQVVVDCEDVADRRKLLTALRKQGRRCRCLTWEGGDPDASLPDAGPAESG
jgi:hypothetical protein